jgi:predicted transcriptional regulator
MTHVQFRNTLEKLGIGLDAFALMLKRSPRTVYRYSQGEIPVPWEVVLLLRYWLRTGIAPDKLR